MDKIKVYDGNEKGIKHIEVKDGDNADYYRWLDTGDINHDFPCLYFAIEHIQDLRQQLATTKAELTKTKEHLAIEESECVRLCNEKNKLQAERAKADDIKEAEIGRDAILKALDICKIYNPSGLNQVNLGALKGYAMSLVDNAESLKPKGNNNA